MKEGKNLFEVDGVQYKDNIPDNMNIGITKEQYAEYMQLKGVKERIKNKINELEERANKIVETYRYASCIYELNEKERRVREIDRQIEILESFLKEE